MRRTVRQVDLNYWRVYDIPLVAGRLFSTEEFDACRDVVVIGEQLAREAFGSAEAAIGKIICSTFALSALSGSPRM